MKNSSKEINLSAKNIIKIYGKRSVVRDVSLNLKKGEIVGLLGPNGAGKTTSFYMITGMVKPTYGSVFLGKKDITNLPMYKRSRKGIGYLSQEPSIFTKLSVEDNIKLVLEMTGFSKEKQKERLEKLLGDLSISQIRKNKGYQLSGGERRRTEICRALVMDPDFILLDEPFAGIDPIAVEDIQQIVQKLCKRGIGVLITDHNVRETLDIVDKVYIANEGSVIFSGTPKEVTSNKTVKSSYLGEDFKFG